MVERNPARRWFGQIGALRRAGALSVENVAATAPWRGSRLGNHRCGAGKDRPHLPEECRRVAGYMESPAPMLFGVVHRRHPPLRRVVLRGSLGVLESLDLQDQGCAVPESDDEVGLIVVV